MLRCTKCGAEKEIGEFARRSASPTGRAPWCKSCFRAYRLENKPREREAARRRYAADPGAFSEKYYLRTYGLTLADKDSLLAAQGGTCAICDTESPGGKYGRWCVDHCHATGKVRGILCDACNKAIGLLCDDPGRMERAAAYVRNS